MTVPQSANASARKAVDTPTGLIDRVRDPAQVHIRTAEPFPTVPLRDVAQVADVTVDGDGVMITGAGDDLLPALMAFLLHHNVPVIELRLDQPTLDDAYLTLTDQQTSGRTAA